MHTLNPRQRQAVRHIDGPLLVLAGAGSGKTRVITHKIVWLMRECGLGARHIAAVTFTNKAAREMKARVQAVAGGAIRGLTVSTFHTLGLNILRQEHAALGLKPGFSIFDPNDCVGAVRELMRAELTTDPGLTEAVHAQISRWKNALLAPEQVPAAAAGEAIKLAAARVYPAYQRQLRACNAVDLDDLILEPVRLFETRPDILSAWQERIRYLLVDEYQDTNATQYALVRMLVGVRGALTVVGDDDQSIYAWRGARPENLAELSQDFPNLTVIKLEQNYRSSGRILKAANTLIAHNPHVFEKHLWSELGYGDPIRVVQARDEEHEAQHVVAALVQHRFTHSTSYRDYAVLYRGNHQSRVFERMLREHRIPYYVSGGTSFFERTEIRDLLAYLRLLANPDDDNAFLRIANTPRRGIGATTLERLGTYAGAHGISLLAAACEPDLHAQLPGRAWDSLREFTQWVVALSHRAERGEPLAVVHDLLNDIHYDDWLKETSSDPDAADRRMENVLELVGWLKRLGERDGEDKTLAALVADITLLGVLEREGEDEIGDSVALMTLHAAKGLEFPHVFIVGAEEELLPHRTSIAEDTLAEERRLLYVGVTRAQRTLTLTLARKRRRYGETVDCAPSRFLAELPPDDLQWEGTGAAVDREEQVSRGVAHLAAIRGLLS